MTALDLAAIRERVEKATEGPWHWAGNTDTGEPYLATWLPGLGRCSVLAIGEEARKTTGREADRVRADAEEFSLGDPEEAVENWATDRFGEPIKDPRLWFFTDLMADPARDHVVYEVAPNAMTREDPKVYRADITGIRHPDAEFIAHARTDVPLLLAALDEATGRAEAAEAALAAVESFAKVQAVTCRASAQPDRPWLDVLAIIERAALASSVTEGSEG